MGLCDLSHGLDVLQGLFHPARKVREVYWRLYNSLYIGAQVSSPLCMRPTSLQMPNVSMLCPVGTSSMLCTA